MTQRIARLVRQLGIVIVCVAVAGLGSAAAQNPGGPRSGRGLGPGAALGTGALGPFGMAVSQLGLTDDQQQQIKSIVQAHRPTLQGYARTEMAARQALQTAQLHGQPDATIRQLHANVAATEADVAVEQTHVLADVLQVLTPEQKAQLTNLQTQMQERRQQRLQRFQQKRNGQ